MLLRIRSAISFGFALIARGSALVARGSLVGPATAVARGSATDRLLVDFFFQTPLHQLQVQDEVPDFFQPLVLDFERFVFDVPLCSSGGIASVAEFDAVGGCMNSTVGRTSPLTEFRSLALFPAPPSSSSVSQLFLLAASASCSSNIKTIGRTCAFSSNSAPAALVRFFSDFLYFAPAAPELRSDACIVRLWLHFLLQLSQLCA